MTVRILIIGESGAGKTSLVNALTGQQFHTSSSAVGTTFDFQKGCRNGVEIIDTVGLDEGEAGRVHPAVTFAKLTKLVKDSQEGFNGILLAMGSPKVTKSVQQNYQLFVEKVTGNKVPCFLYISKQELEDDPHFSCQFETNRHLYILSGLKLEDGFAGGVKTPEAREYTIKRFDDCVAQCPRESVRLYEEGNWATFLVSVWSFVFSSLCKLLGVECEKPLYKGSFAGVLHLQLGVPHDIALDFQVKTMRPGGLTQQDIDDLAEALNKVYASN